MKTIDFILAITFVLNFSFINLFSQEKFDPDRYKSFLEKNKNFTTEQLLENNPRQSDYYDDRSIRTDLSEIPWFDSIHQHYDLTGHEMELLSKNHFMVTERLKTYSWASAFIDIYSKDMPVFISTDFVLHTLHQSYDAILKHIELRLLEPNLNELLEAMYDSYVELYNKYKGHDGISEALADVDLYVSIAYSLAQDKEIKPHYADMSEYAGIIDAVRSEKLVMMKLFTENRKRKLDFSQFKPRGHYTQEMYTSGGVRTLENYFRAMMWLGRIDFLLTAPPENPWETDWTKEELQRMQLGALLLNELLNTCGKKDLYETHEKIITFLVGPDDNLTPGELTHLAGDMLNSPMDILHDDSYTEFTNALNSSDDYGQKIMSNFIYVDPRSEEPGKLPVSFRLLGQKFLLDSYITAEVVYDRIIWNGEKIHRDLPDPLDVLSTLGNENAMELMKEEMEEYHYAYKINELKELISYYDDSFWEQSLYNVWLSSITTLNPSSNTDHLPFFMQTTAWHHEKLNTQLVSWAELRHDNILYGKQSYTGGTGCSFPYTYIEPYPALYGQIQKFAMKASDFFGEVLGENNNITDHFERYSGIMKNFKTIAEKELDGTALNDGEILFLKTMINSMMISGPSITGWYNDLFYDPMKGLQEDFIVADIHTQPTDKYGNIVGHVYHVGTGFINRGMFLAPNPVNPGQIMAFTGPVSSFLYEITNNFYRYNDEEWQNKMWAQDSKASAPDWVSNYLAGSDGKPLPEGRTLKGKMYMVANNDIGTDMKDLDYLITFPNPARNVVHLRFVLNKTSDITIAIYDLKGSMLSKTYQSNVSPAEHDIPLNIADLEKGNYLIRFTYSGQSITKMIQVQ